MTRSLLIAATLLVGVACSGNDSDHETSSCPEGLSCSAGRGGAAPGSWNTAGATSASTGGFATGSGGNATGGDGPGSGGTAGTLPDRCTIIDGSTAAALVADGALLVDVRTSEEFAAEHVAGAINIPLAEIPDRLDEFPTDGPIVVYCRSGSRSAQASSILCDAGLYVLDVGAMSNYSSGSP